MDPLRSYLGRLLQEEITPVIMVLSTPLVEDACQKNGLNFIELLLPFSVFNKINVPVRTASDQPYRLQMFKLRLAYASDIHLQNYEAAEEHLKKVVLDASQKTLTDLISEPPQLENLLKNSESDLCPSWIETFNKELIRTLSFSEHETFDHPVACLLVVSSKDEQPINRFVDILNTNQLPSLLSDGVMDPKVLKHYLLLHDNQDGSPEKITSILAEMRNTYGSNCKLLCINSSQSANGNGKDIQWMPYGSHVLRNDDIACFLSTDDINAVRDFMLDLSSNYVIPHVEQKIRILNQQVAATRKGFRNQIKNLWWRKGKEDTPETANGPIYTFSSIESQIRVLADYAFMLRDYELALSNYRLLSTDYKLDKAWKRYAGVQEMTGLCYFMLDQSRKDSEYCMESAFTTYLKIGSSSQRNASRCGLWWAEMLKARGQFKDAANIYFRISNEEPSLLAAVMLEQASYCYLLSSPPMLRKYGFHLVLAGNRYYMSDQRHHAIQAYRNALFVYKQNGWTYISDHVHYNVGRWYSFIGILDVAVKHMLEVLACSHQSLATQNMFLNDFFHIVQSMGKKFEVYKLRLPVINMASLKVLYEDFRTYASPSDVHVSESLWQSLEEELVPSASTGRSNWLDSQIKSSSSKRNDESPVCVAGESVVVDLEFINPLQVSISVSEISLICELMAKSKEPDTGSASHTAPEEDSELKDSPSCRDSNSDGSSFTLSKLDVVLGGGETKRIQLEVSPKIEGLLKISGVRWTLSDIVVGYQYFEFDLKNKEKKGRRARRSLSHNLSFIVIKGLPKLDACIQHLPKKVFAGDLRLLLLELHNQSEFSVKNIKMKISHPRYLIPGNIEDLEMDFPECLEKQKSSGSKETPANVMLKFKNLLFSFPDDATIQGGTNFTWPLWFHAGLSGRISLYISIYYEVASCSSDMKYRILRMHHDLEVLPSLDVSFQISPCESSLEEYFVRMDILNRTKSETFSLNQLSCVGNLWEILALPESLSMQPVQTLLAGQALSCFFKLKDCRKVINTEGEVTLQGSDLLMISHSCKEAMIDVSRSPLAEFHQHERFHQGKSAKGDSSIVDFILISKMQGNGPVFEPGMQPKLLSYHACHCSISSRCPLSWQMNGPRMINHDFSGSFCEANFHLRIHSCSDAAVIIRLTTYDTLPEKNQSSDGVKLSDSAENEGGWHDISLVNDMKVLSSVHGNQPKKSSVDTLSPFVWCATSSTKLKLEPLCTTEISLKICLFAAGTYDLSNYELHWEVKPLEEGIAGVSSSGTAHGHPFYLTVLHAPR
uniref:Trafficking protein particle complex subunit 8 n=1 Tax=Musa acuminata subsp. malaccensis TaxID=214687 RepID=A0A804IYD3_MUSAM|nr:PREDICTED: trafficking protein particle complex subunit 8 isoform X1 [Musa acuminata subsp. malaccensis]XP_009397413.1 PREDICTED: trafficking protein particle complex subunit 8 isoform X1 [Musa acuminata subsp. malaccensis]